MKRGEARQRVFHSWAGGRAGLGRIGRCSPTQKSSQEWRSRPGRTVSLGGILQAPQGQVGREEGWMDLKIHGRGEVRRVVITISFLPGPASPPASARPVGDAGADIHASRHGCLGIPSSSGREIPISLLV